jgi:hypothetical protein
MKKITILTDPIPHRNIYLTEYLKIFIRFFRDIFFNPKQNYNKSKFRGHFAVTRSLVTGLMKLKYDFNYNPKNIKNLYENVIVLAGVKTLKQCIELKENGLIKNLYAGPNIVIFSSDHNYIISNKQINKVITPSKWVSEMYIKECPLLINRCIEWPAGIDIDYWSPNLNINKSQIIIYDKRLEDSKVEINKYIDLIKSYGFSIRILKYGTYTHKDYFDQLNRTQLMICFSNGSESQGIAWNEAWSMNVPTLIFESNTNVYAGKFYKCSSAPYLNSNNGSFFNDISSFKNLFISWINKEIIFEPRKWSILNASDEISAKQLYHNLIN